MNPIDLKTLLEAGCHFGHKTNKWNPKARDFIYKAVGGTHIIDLVKTKEGLEQAALHIYNQAKNGRVLLMVGTKRQAQSIIKSIAEKYGTPYFNQRWIGGFITNFEEVRKNLDKLSTRKKTLADKQVASQYTKLERLNIQREVNKLENIYGGVANLERRPDMIFVVDVRKESATVKEASQYHIPVIGIVDTNSNTEGITYPIPANDDAIGSITCITTYLGQAYQEGYSEFEKKKTEEKANELKAKEAEEKRIQEKAEKEKKAEKTEEKETV